MYEYEDLNYEINKIFDYMIKYPKGNVKSIENNTNIPKSDILIILNIFSKSGIIIKLKDIGNKGFGSSYSLNKVISSVSFGKAVNLGIDINQLEKHFTLENNESLSELTYFIKSGELEQAIEFEENKKREDFIDSIKEKCNTELAETNLSIHIQNIKSLLSKENDVEFSPVVKNLLDEISCEIEKEYDEMRDKLINKKILLKG